MGALVVVLLVALAIAASVLLYAAYPYRGEETPVSPRLGEAMRRGVLSLPTLDAEQHQILVDRREHASSRAATRR
jgi:hypothetical protein